MNEFRFLNLDALHWLWLVPVLAALFFFASQKRRQALARLIDSQLLERIRISVSLMRRRWKAALLLVAVTSLVVALARPSWNPTEKNVQRSGRDVVFLLDVSRSMLAEDLAPNRLERAKLAIMDCVEGLEGDRVGLVIFAGNAMVKCPLTLDYGFFRMMLDDISTESITRGGTLMGDALRFVLENVFDDQAKQFKDIILITDGEDHDSFPVQAAEGVGEKGVRLIAIGLGDESEGKRIPITTSDGRKTFLKHAGREVWSRLDAMTLRKMAKLTKGGRYLNVATGTFDLGKIYQDIIATADKKQLEDTNITNYEDRFQIFILLTLILISIEFLLSDRIKQKP